jgi:hypothetical protein
MNIRRQLTPRNECRSIRRNAALKQQQQKASGKLDELKSSIKGRIKGLPIYIPLCEEASQIQNDRRAMDRF